jgi:hypothetical protein
VTGDRLDYDRLVMQLLQEMSFHARSGLLPSLMGLRVHGRRLLYLHGTQLYADATAMQPVLAVQRLQRLSRWLQALGRQRTTLLALRAELELAVLARQIALKSGEIATELAR